jgi:predicted transcriptional regulator of viral defense system
MPKYLGPKETEIISRLTYEKTGIITTQQFNRLFGQNVLTRQVIYQLKKKGILKPIIRGIYYFSPLEAGPAGTRINEFLIPPALFPKGNYYVAYSTMYNYYGFTEQIFQAFYILNTSLQRERIIAGIPFKLLKVSLNRMFGLTKIKIGNSEIIVSDRERTLVDLFYFSDPVGGLKKASKILEIQLKTKKIDIRKLIKYAMLFPNISTRKRIGYFLEKSGVSRANLMPLIRNLRNTSLITLYGSKSRKGSINYNWKVIIDDTQ